MKFHLSRDKPPTFERRNAYDIIDTRGQRDILFAERIDVSQVWAWRPFVEQGLRYKPRVEARG